MSDFDIDAVIALDKPGMRSLNTTSQLQKQIDLCASGEISTQAFYMNVAFELGLVTRDDWNYLQANSCVPSVEMLERLLAIIRGWNVVDVDKLNTLK